MQEGSSTGVQSRIDEIKEQAVNRFVYCLSIAACLAYLASISRAINIGWQDLFYLQTLYLCAIGITFYFRKKLNYKTILKVYLWLGIMIATPGLYTFGFMGGAVFIALLCPLLSLLFLDKKTTTLITIVIVIIYLFCAYSFIHGGNKLPTHETSYITSPIAWAVILFDTILFFVVLGISAGYFQKQLTLLLVKLEHKNTVIEAQKQQIEHLANHDALTGLLSLRAANIELDLVLEQAKQQGHLSALLFLDLDGFKAINDNHGHAAGDLVLQTVAKRISSSIRSVDKACRIGGDEFLIIVSKYEKTADIANLCSRLLQEICQPIFYNCFDLTVSCSIGAASYPNHAKDANTLRIKADESMYKVKKAGKKNFWISQDNHQ